MASQYVQDSTTKTVNFSELITAQGVHDDRHLGLDLTNVTNESSINGMGTTLTKLNITSQAGVVGVMKELDRLQGEQVQQARKIEKEKKRKEALDVALKEARAKLRTFQDATKGGSITKEEDTVSRKLIGKMEYSLQQSRLKLSATHKDNAAMKRRIDETRQDKNMHLTILRNLEREYHDSKVKIATQQKEIIEVNEEKHRLDVKISNLKEEMFRDMNLFSNELVAAKLNISDTQANILDSIRDRLQTTFNNLDLMEENEHIPHTHVAVVKHHNEAEDRRVALESLLAEVGGSDLGELIVTLQQSEEQIFAKYAYIQAATTEMEKLDLENKHLDAQVSAQMADLHELETSSAAKQHELEASITSIQKATERYEYDFINNEESLHIMQGNLIKLFKTIAMDEALDQQILETGVNDRNIPEYLGIVEQRIDELIQMKKAAEHQLLEREDFGKSAFKKKEGSIVRPVLPDSQADAADDEDERYDDDGTGKILPVNIALLKDFMNKKVQRGLKKKDLQEALAKAGKQNSRGGGSREASTPDGKPAEPVKRRNKAAQIVERKGTNYNKSPDIVGVDGSLKKPDAIRRSSTTTKATTTATNSNSNITTVNTDDYVAMPTTPSSERRSASGSGKRSSVNITRDISATLRAITPK